MHTGTRSKRKASKSIANEGVGDSKRNKISPRKTDITIGTRKKAFSKSTTNILECYVSLKDKVLMIPKILKCL